MQTYTSVQTGNARGTTIYRRKNEWYYRCDVLAYLPRERYVVDLTGRASTDAVCAPSHCFSSKELFILWYMCGVHVRHTCTPHMCDDCLHYRTLYVVHVWRTGCFLQRTCSSYMYGRGLWTTPFCKVTSLLTGCVIQFYQGYDTYRSLTPKLLQNFQVSMYNAISP